MDTIPAEDCTEPWPAEPRSEESRSCGTNPLIGTWRLVRGEVLDSDGTVRAPWGNDAVGWLLYGSDGGMAATIMVAHRPVFAADDMRRGTASEKAEAFETYLAYTGTYEVRGDRVVHRIVASLFPNWTGTEQERHVALAEDRLTLTTPTISFGGSEQIGRLVWERFGKAEGGSLEKESS
jgi:hypothetical protein